MCVIHIKGCKISSSASGMALILSQAASTTVRTERHFYTSVLTNVSPVWNAVCTAVLIPQQHVKNYLDEIIFYSYYAFSSVLGKFLHNPNAEECFPLLGVYILRLLHLPLGCSLCSWKALFTASALLQ